MKKVSAGKHPYIRLNHFSKVEIAIIEKLSKEWYITNGGDVIKLGNTSSYGYFLMKPTDSFQKMFNLTREVIVVFSSYSSFEPRTLDIFDYVYEKYQTLRLENICTVLISGDKNVSSKLSNLLKADPESRIIVPFNYNEILTYTDKYFITNRFRNKFYSRDLFSFQAPIKNEFFFFGRNDLVHEIVNRHLSGENSGLFGLRKTGKTSVIFSIRRTLKIQKETSVFIDCQNPSFHKKRWNKALYYVIKQLKEQNHLTIKTNDANKYQEDAASELFEEDLLKIHASKSNKKRNILLIFDEIENITKDISPSEHWSNSMDFVLFWQSIRSIFQKFILTKEKNIFTFLIVGTNPKCVEMPIINNSDNPIFKKIPYQYIKGFDVPHTKEMVNMLGGYMGLKFDESIYGKLTDEFGGHPFLIRQMCSTINKLFDGDKRPVRVDKAHYKKAKETFNRENSTYIAMILSVLKDFYPAEFDMLTYLALDDFESFNSLAQEFPELVSHLLGYNVIDYNEGNYIFIIEAVKDYLIKQNKYKVKLHTNKDKWKEISERRNELEVNIRTVIRMQLQAIHGKPEAKRIILEIMGNPRKTQYSSYSYVDLFKKNGIHIYLNDLIKIISKNYDSFKNIFGVNQKDTIRKLEAINERRADAHANSIDNDEIEYFRVCISSIEKKLNEFL